jgi:Arc/MetJ-type ribon-helix-helix transcriptional regulator
MRKTFNISVPEPMYEYILKNSQGWRYGSVSEYIRSLVRRDQDERALLAGPIRIRKANDYARELGYELSADDDDDADDAGGGLAKRPC